MLTMSKQCAWKIFPILDEKFPSHKTDEIDSYVNALFKSNGKEYNSPSNANQWFNQKKHTTFRSMVKALISSYPQPSDLVNVDLVILAHWTPDAELGTAVTNYALHLIGAKNAFGFAISDRNTAAPFFALHYINQFKSNKLVKTLLFIMDQPQFFYLTKHYASRIPFGSAGLFSLVNHSYNFQSQKNTYNDLEYIGYKKVINGKNNLNNAIKNIIDSFNIVLNEMTVIGEYGLIIKLDPSIHSTAVDRRLLSVAPFVRLIEKNNSKRTLLLITKDGSDLIAAAFKDREKT